MLHCVCSLSDTLAELTLFLGRVAKLCDLVLDPLSSALGSIGNQPSVAYLNRVKLLIFVELRVVIFDPSGLLHGVLNLFNLSPSFSLGFLILLLLSAKRAAVLKKLPLSQ